jgi:hypothetical protein
MQEDSKPKKAPQDACHAVVAHVRKEVAENNLFTLEIFLVARNVINTGSVPNALWNV